MKPTKPGFWFCNTGERFEPVNVWEAGGVLFFENFPHSDGPVVEDELVDDTDASDWGPEIKMEERCSHEETQRDYKMFADAAAELESSRELRRRLEKILQEKNDND